MARAQDVLGRGRRRRSRPADAMAAAVVVAGAVVLGAACSSGSPRSATPPPSPTSTAAARPAPPSTTTTAPSPSTTTTVPPLPVVPITWSACGGGLQCGSVTAPLDYANPAGRTITIAVARRPALDPTHRLGSLVINPGGPGGSGIDDLPAELRVLTPGLQQRFDIVSFDPRGVGRTAPVHCEPPNQPPVNTTGPLIDPAPLTSAGEQRLLTGDRQYAASCQRYSGDLLAHVGTDSTARDLDRIRAAIGDQQLTYIGHSYGTLLGATYAEMFPTRVRAMVLDGAIDPALSLDQLELDQAKGFERVLQDFFAWCQGSPSCLWRPAGKPESDLVALISITRQRPLSAGGGQVAGPGEVYEGVLANLYSRRSWPTLAGALSAADRGNGGPLVRMARAYLNQGAPNGADANAAIDCLDDPVSRDPSTYAPEAAASAGQAPVFGPLLMWGGLGCSVWPVPPTRRPHAIGAAGSAPIVVVGTTGDSATPYQWAVNLAGELRHGILVTRVGEDHVAYYYSTCVRAMAQAYLMQLVLPPPGTVCS